MRRSRKAEDPDRTFKLHMTDGGPRFILSAQPPSIEAAPTPTDEAPRARPTHGRAASHMRPAARRSSRPSRAETRPVEVDVERALPQLVRPMDAPTQTHTVLDAYDSERLPNAFWKAALPPSASPPPAPVVSTAPVRTAAVSTAPVAVVAAPTSESQPVAISIAADYTVGSGIERVHAPVAAPEQAVQIIEQAISEAQERARRAGPSMLTRAWRAVRDTRVPPSLGVGAVVVAFVALAILRLWPDGTTPQDVAVAPPMAVVRTDAPPPAVPQGSAMQQALGHGQYTVVARSADGSLTDRSQTEDLVGSDLETVQKLARIKSETLAQPLFIIALRGGEPKVVERVNPQDRQAWREYTLAVWDLKQQSLSWPREYYLTRAALDPRRTLGVMRDFVRNHPNSRLVGAAFEDMRYVCYHTLQDPAKFRAITMELLDEALRHPGAIPEIVYVVKPYLTDAVNQMLYQRVHRFLGQQQAAAN